MLVFYLLICLFCFIFLPGFVWFLGVLGCVVLCWVGFCRELLTVLCVRSGLVCFCWFGSAAFWSRCWMWLVLAGGAINLPLAGVLCSGCCAGKRG